MKNKKIIAVIPVRGGSKSIPGKNIRTFAGRPLVYWTILAAHNSDVVGDVFIPTDSRQVKDIVEGFGFKDVYVIERSKKSCSDEASSEDVLLEIAQKYEFDDMVFLQATNPFVVCSDIDKAYEMYQEKGFDSLFSAVEQRRFIWEKTNSITGALNYDYKARPRRQDFKGFWVENGAFYITSRDNLLKHKNRLSGKIGVYEMPLHSYFELDDPDDWLIAEAVFFKKMI